MRPQLNGAPWEGRDMLRSITRLASVVALALLLIVPCVSLEASAPEGGERSLLTTILAWIGWGGWEVGQSSTGGVDTPPVEVIEPGDDPQPTSTTPDSDTEMYPEWDPDG